MATSNCASGSKWDYLLKLCIPSQQPTTRTVLVVGVTPGTDPDQPWASGMWICVCIVLISSIIILLLCFIVYIHHVHVKGQRNSKPPAPHQNGTTNHLGSAREHKGDFLTDFPNSHGRVQVVPLCERDCGSGWSLCKARAEHVVPLPATELGDSALVTTKTVQPVECFYSEDP